PKTCPTCGGYGKIRHSQGFFTLERTCPGCHGRGEVIDNPCAACAGSGRVRRERTLSVNVPAGGGDGRRLRPAGEGEAGMGGGPTGRGGATEAEQAPRRAVGPRRGASLQRDPRGSVGLLGESQGVPRRPGKTCQRPRGSAGGRIGLTLGQAPSTRHPCT